MDMTPIAVPYEAELAFLRNVTKLDWQAFNPNGRPVEPMAVLEPERVVFHSAGMSLPKSHELSLHFTKLGVHARPDKKRGPKTVEPAFTLSFAEVEKLRANKHTEKYLSEPEVVPEILRTRQHTDDIGFLGEQTHQRWQDTHSGFYSSALFRREANDLKEALRERGVYALEKETHGCVRLLVQREDMPALREASQGKSTIFDEICNRSVQER